MDEPSRKRARKRENLMQEQEQERALVARAKRGDPSAFEQLIYQNEKKIYQLALRMVGNREDALDLAQEAFLKAWNGLRQFQGGSSFSTWLYRLTVNGCLDFLRSRKRRQDALGQIASLDDETAFTIPTGDREQEPEVWLERRERERTLHRAIENLDEKYRVILILREFSGLSYQEISQTLSLDIGTVKSRISRARMALRESLCADGNFFHSSASNLKRSDRNGKGSDPA